LLALACFAAKAVDSVATPKIVTSPTIAIDLLVMENPSGFLGQAN
jgi:hypothetical protein